MTGGPGSTCCEGGFVIGKSIWYLLLSQVSLRPSFILWPGCYMEFGNLSGAWLVLLASSPLSSSSLSVDPPKRCLLAGFLEEADFGLIDFDDDGPERSMVAEGVGRTRWARRMTSESAGRART